MVGAPKLAVTRTSFSNSGKPISVYARFRFSACFVFANYHENFAERMIFFQLPESLLQLLLYCLAAALRATSFQPGASLNAAFTTGQTSLVSRPLAKTRSFAFPGDGFEQE
jgi:hypothetical protein